VPASGIRMRASIAVYLRVYLLRAVATTGRPSRGSGRRARTPGGTHTLSEHGLARAKRSPMLPPKLVRLLPPSLDVSRHRPLEPTPTSTVPPRTLTMLQASAAATLPPTFRALPPFFVLRWQSGCGTNAVCPMTHALVPCFTWYKAASTGDSIVAQIATGTAYRFVWGLWYHAHGEVGLLHRSHVGSSLRLLHEGPNGRWRWSLQRWRPEHGRCCRF
jgi:hypothetical protein